MEKIGVCVIGAGRAGMVHAANFKNEVPGARLVAIVDSEPEAAERAASKLGVEHIYSDFRAALENPKVNAVCITTPTFTHAEIAIVAASAGKHTFCEKPLALNLEEATRMLEAAKKTGVKLQVGFMRRFDPAMQKSKKLLEEKVIGTPMIIRSVTRGPGLPPRWAWDSKLSNGMLAEVNSHDFDAVRWLTNSEFVRFHVETAAIKFPEIRKEFPDFYDNAVVSFRLANGILGIIEGSCPVGYGYDARMEILGTEGVMTIGELRSEAVTLCTKKDGVIQSTFPSWQERFKEAYVAEVQHFVECILEDKEPLVTGLDGKKTLEAILAVKESISTGQPVNLLFK